MRAHAAPAQVARYAQPLQQGRWLGTMCLSEPQAGSSLADVACRATPADDGTYRIAGAKMWISGGEHELAANIVHLVLARLPDAPPGKKGLSLFIVPKFRVGADGNPGAHNDVVCLLVYDPFMLELPQRGDIVISGGSLQAELSLGQGGTRQSIDRFARDRGRELQAWQKELGLPMLPVSTAEETAPQLRRLLEQSAWRQRRR